MTAAARLRRHRGFTLLEVVVALSLLAVALALALGTLRGATGATARAEGTAQRDERLRAVQGLLRRTGGNVTRAAGILGMHRQSLQHKLRELGLARRYVSVSGETQEKSDN